MHHALGLGLLAFLLVFAFGKPAARCIIGGGLIIVALAFVYVMLRIITGSV